MIKGFNNYKKSDQERLFWNMTILIVIILFISFFIPYIIIDSSTFIEKQLVTQAKVLQKSFDNGDGTYLYRLKYMVDNGDTLNSKLFSSQDYETGDVFKIYYSDSDNFYIREYDGVNSYHKSVLILIVAWFIVLSFIFLTAFKPDFILKFKGDFNA